MMSTLHVATSEGVVTISSRSSGQWGVDRKSLSAWAVSEVVAHPTQPGHLYAATHGDGVWVSKDSGETWFKPNRGRPGPGKVRCLAVDSRDPDRVYAGTEPIGVWVSEDQCKSWNELRSVWDVPGVAQIDYPVPAVEPHVRDVVIDCGDPEIIYAALQVGFMIKSVDAGASWTLLHENLDADVHTIVQRPDDPEHLFVATGGHDCRQGRSTGRALYDSIDGGATWRPTCMEFDQEFSVPLVLHPEHPNVVYSAIASGHPQLWPQRQSGANALLVRSEDGGESWEALNTGVEELGRDFPQALVIDPERPEFMFASTAKGEVFGSEDRGDSWFRTGVKVPKVSSMALGARG